MWAGVINPSKSPFQEDGVRGRREGGGNQPYQVPFSGGGEAKDGGSEGREGGAAGGKKRVRAINPTKSPFQVGV